MHEDVQDVNRQPLPLIFPVLLCALLWGSAFPVIKLVYGHWAELGVEVSLWDRWLFAGLRFTVAGLALLAVAKQPWVELRRSSVATLIVFTLGQTFFQYVFFYAGLAISSGSLGALLAATGSFWWMILAPVVLGHAWPERRQWMILSVGASGVVLAVYAPGAGAGNPVLGATLLLCASFSGAIGILMMSKLKTTMGARAASGFSLFFGGVALLLLALPAWGRAELLFDPYVLVWTCWLALVSAVAFGIWNYLSTLYPVPLLASYRFLIPVTGVIESLLFLEGESAGWGLVIGGALVIGSLFVATRQK